MKINRNKSWSQKNGLFHNTIVMAMVERRETFLHIFKGVEKKPMHGLYAGTNIHCNEAALIQENKHN